MPVGSNMNWREESQYKSSRELGERDFLKIAKKIRDVLKIEALLEAGERVEANQKKKLETKQQLCIEILAVEDITACFWDKNEDIFQALSKKQQGELKEMYRSEREEINRKKEEEAARRANFKINKDDERRREIEVEFVPRHERPVTDLVYAAPYLYSSSKDKFCIRWDVSTKLKAVTTMCGHEGSVWCLDVHQASNTLVSGGADGYLCLWSTQVDEQNGMLIPSKTQTPTKKKEYGGIIRNLRVHDAGIVLQTDKFGRTPAAIALLSLDAETTKWKLTDFEPAIGLGKLNMLLWGPVGKPKIFSCHDDGQMAVWGADADECASPNEDGSLKPKVLKKFKPHEGSIISMNTHKNFILTASSDKTAKAINAGVPSLDVAYMAKADRPLRAVAGFDYTEKKCFGFVYGGGREPREVTTSTLLPDEFEFFQNYFGKWSTKSKSNRAHVGPIHRLMWLPELQRVFSASEDGDVKMWADNTMDKMWGEGKQGEMLQIR